ncbi:MAG: type VI secretion system contractile sheath small subunit [Terriglobia bacterium]|jgi:type VI secretion system protein ImpB
MPQSVQKKLERVRPPRVHVTYDVETGGAIEIKELPFVMGVLGDFSGQPTEPLPRLKDRRFVEVNPDNFDSVLESMKPHLAYAVENKLSEDAEAGQLKVSLDFKSMDDFSPENVAKQVKPLRELLDLRTRLNDLKGTLQTNDKLDQVLLDAVSNTDKLNQLRTELGGKKEGEEKEGSNG